LLPEVPLVPGFQLLPELLPALAVQLFPGVPLVLEDPRCSS